MKEGLNFKTTKEISISSNLVDQVIGQERAVNLIKKASLQRRNVLLMGKPGTGKSLLGQALAELLPKRELEDIICLPNPKDEDRPKIQAVPRGEGKKIRNRGVLSGLKGKGKDKGFFWLLIALLIINGISLFFEYISEGESDVLRAANRINATIMTLMFLLFFMMYIASTQLKGQRIKVVSPKVLVDNSENDHAPFIDATSSHEGALLGDVKHDPFQSGGLGTPSHELVMAGSIHKAHKGVLFIDEVATLKPEMQIELLTAMQEKKMSITGRSERSSGAMIQTEPVPCDFLLVAAGNTESLHKINPAMRSRIRGYGYEVYMNEYIEDTFENQVKLARFVAQEVKKDGNIPHFTKAAVLEVLKEARRRSGRRGKLTLKLRDLGGLIRVSGDLALEKKSKLVDAEHVLNAKELGISLEAQVVNEYMEVKKDYELIKNSGSEVGRVNGLAVMGGEDTRSGIVLPIEAVISPSLSRGESKIIATGKLGTIAMEAVSNVSAIIKKFSKKSLVNNDIHIQFLQTYEGVEGDSASVSIATAVISSLVNKPVSQDVCMTGSLSIRGTVMPIGGVNEKVEAAIKAGFKRVIIPKLNEKDLVLDKKLLKKIKIIPVDSLSDVIKHALIGGLSVSKQIKKVSY